MPIRSKTCRAVVVCLSALLPGGVCAEGIDTEHLFGFMIGTDVGNVGERELQSQTTGRFCQEWRNYRAVGQEFELEFVPVKNFRVELGTTFASHYIRGVPGLEDRRQLSWEGVSVDLRYRFLDRDAAPFGFTFAVENHASRIDETTAAAVRSYGTEFTAGVRPRTDSKRRRRRPQSDLPAGMDAHYRHRSRRAGIDHRRCARPDGANASGLLSRRRSALSAAL